MAGFCDVEQRLCLGLALWNGRDPILKERMFGLTGAEGNHGEDVKEYWWYLDAVPSHAWNRWRYHYPQRAFPYGDLLAENGAARAGSTRSTNCSTPACSTTTGTGSVEVDYVKADPTDLLMTVRVTNAGPDTETLHVLPTVWFRNTWSWDVDAEKPSLHAGARRHHRDRPPVPRASWSCWRPPAPTAPRPVALFCENETNTRRLFGDDVRDARFPRTASTTTWSVATTRSTRPPRGRRRRSWYRVSVEPGATVELRLRLRPVGSDDVGPAAALGDGLRRGRGPAARRGRRVLCRTDARPTRPPTGPS